MLSLFYMLAISNFQTCGSWNDALTALCKLFFLNDPYVTWFCSRHRSLLPPVTSWQCLAMECVINSGLHLSPYLRRYMGTKFTKSFITEMVLSPSGEWTLWSRNSTVADYCVMRLCLFFGRVWGRRLCNFHIDCSYVWELIISVVNFDFTVSVSDSLGKQLKHSDVPFYYWWLFAAPLACWYLSGCFFNRLLIIKLIIQGGCL